MIWMTRRILRDFPSYERPIQLSIVIGVCVLGIALVLALISPDVRPFALAGLFGCLVVMEVAVMIANRGMIGVYSHAQSRYLQGDLDGAVRDLEAYMHTKPKAWREQTLLGNLYRQQGRLDISTAVLYEAVNNAPPHAFPRYGLARTLLVNGEYTAACEQLEMAAQMGSDEGVQLDLAEAYFRAGDLERARHALKNAAKRETEPYRVLLRSWLEFRVNGQPMRADDAEIAGVLFFQAAAERFAHTPYGAALHIELAELNDLLLNASSTTA
jgi:tetratricopeptide (TPR) repeat protein